MSNLHFTTKHANAATVKHNWFIVDGANQTVGRMCAKIAAILRGKNKAYYTPHVDCGDYVIVINADKVVFTGNKLEDKLYDTYSGYPGGLKQEKAELAENRHRTSVNESPRERAFRWTSKMLPYAPVNKEEVFKHV